MKKKTLIIIIGFFLCVITAWGVSLKGCRTGTAYTVLGFSYPPGSKIHEGDWTYIGKAIVTSDKPGSEFKISEKTVIFLVKDKKNNILLREELKFANCGGIDRKTTWDKFEEINIDLYEKIVIDEKLSEDGKVCLHLETSSSPLCKLKFRYNQQKKQFELVEKIDLKGGKGLRHL